MYLFPRKCTSDRRLDGKTVLITGCNSGIGKEVTKMLYGRGAKIVMACINEENARIAKEEIENFYHQNFVEYKRLGELRIVKLDLCSLASIRSCAKEVLDTESRLDVLINNAGFSGKKEITVDGFEKTFFVNYLGHLQLTLLLLPLLIKSKPSKIVNVASYFYIFGTMDLKDLQFERTKYTTLTAYGRSKLAIIMTSKYLSYKLKERGIDDVNVYSLHPGIGRTGIGRNLNDVFPGLAFLWTDVLMRCCMSVEDCCQTILYCVIDEKCDDESGLHYSNCQVNTLYNKANNPEKAEKLWKISCELLGYFSENVF